MAKMYTTDVVSVPCILKYGESLTYGKEYLATSRPSHNNRFFYYMVVNDLGETEEYFDHTFINSKDFPKYRDDKIMEQEKQRQIDESNKQCENFLNGFENLYKGECGFHYSLRHFTGNSTDITVKDGGYYINSLQFSKEIGEKLIKDLDNVKAFSNNTTHLR